MADKESSEHRELMLGYSVLLLLLVGISVFAMYNLNRLNEISSSIHETDLPIVNISGKMIDVILAQEFYVQRYLILKSPDIYKDFWHKENVFIFLCLKYYYFDCFYYLND